MAHQLVNKIKRQIVLAAHSVGEGHIPSALSILDILWVLYDRVLKFDARQPNKLEMDKFVLSKGHASLALYSILAAKEFFPPEGLETFCKFGSKLGGHPDCNKVPGVEASTGSLGHGFPMAVGLALGAKINQIDNRVFCLIGDGESNEGSIWESALLAAHHELSNLCCIIDYNHSTDRALNMGNLAEKFISFGWHAITINGHDHNEIYSALSDRSKLLPTIVIAETIKGCGIKRMENDPAWHHRSPNVDELKEILEELK